MTAELSEKNIPSPKNNYFIKARFRSGTLNLYGLLLLMYNQKGEIASFNVVVSTFSNLFDLEPHISWDKYEEAIVDQRWKGNCNTSMTTGLMSQFENLNTDSYIRDQLFAAINKYDYTHIDNILFDLVNRIVQDKNMSLESGIQEATPEEIESIKKKRDQGIQAKKEKSSNTINIEKGSTIIETSLILAPVKGKPLYELKIGDKVMLRIEPRTQQSNYFIDLYELRVDDKIKPIPGEVIDIKAQSKSDPVQIIARIDEGLYGKSLEDERQVKVRLYDPLLDGEFKHKSTKITNEIKSTRISKENEFSPVNLILVLIFGILLLFFIILIYILI